MAMESTLRHSMNKLSALWVVGAMLLMTAQAQAGPWVRDAGEGYLKLGGSSFVGDQYYRAGVPTELESKASSLSVYGEVGLGHALQLVMYLPYQVASNETGGGVRYVNHTLGDLRLQVDTKLTDAFPLALSLEAKVPLYEVVSEQELTGEQEAWRTNFPDVGDGNLDLTLKLQAGASLGWLGGWVTGVLGYTKRLGRYIDSLYFAGQVGVWIWEDHIRASFYGQGNRNLGTDAFPEILASRESVSLEGTVAVTGIPMWPELDVMVSWGEVVYARYGSKGSVASVAIARAW